MFFNNDFLHIHSVYETVFQDLEIYFGIVHLPFYIFAVSSAFRTFRVPGRSVATF